MKIIPSFPLIVKGIGRNSYLFTSIQFTAVSHAKPIGPAFAWGGVALMRYNPVRIDYFGNASFF